MSVEQAIRKMMTEQSAVNATLPLGQDACGDDKPQKQGSSEDFGADEQDETAPGTTTAKNIGQTTIQDQGDATTVRIQSMESIKTDIAALFAGQENLAEGFVEKASSIFEAAVVGRVNAEMITVNEALEAQSEKELNLLKAALTEQVDLYMTEMVKVWAEENKIAIDVGLKQEVSESFINGLKDLFTEHYIEVPDGKVDVLESLTDELESSKKRINEEVNEKLAIQEELTDLKKQAVIAEATKGMTAIDADRMLALVEGVDFDSQSLYTEKVAVIKEQHFKKTAKKSAEMLLAESSGNNEQEHISTNVQRYVDALTRGKSTNIFTE